METKQELLETYVDMDEYPNLNEAILCELNNLLQMAHPRTLRKSLQQAMFPYLMQSKDTMSYDFQEVTHHLHLLIEFWDVVEEKQRRDRR